MDNDRVDKLLAELTLEEKVSLTAGADMWHTPALERLGIPPFKMSDGPVGVRGANNTGGPPSACFPCGTALAATWDVDLVEQVGVELGREAVAKGAHVLLAPTTNIHRHPLAGRNFECFSEDPELAGRMSIAYVRGVQSQGVAACIKHFVANDSEFERFTISSEVPERALREIYLRPFELAVAEARPWAIMASYNRLYGTYTSEHPWLLTRVLRDEWGFDGVVISDWAATHSTVEAAAAGLDLEMPGPTRHRGSKLVDAVRSGALDGTAVDAMARNLLVAMDRTGALDATPVPERADDSPQRRAVARAAAAGAIVLLRNDAVGGTPVLPLAVGSLSRVAVIGPNADALNILGGGSAALSPYRAVSPLDGLRAALAPAGVEVVHEPGCSITRWPQPIDLRWVSTPEGEPGIAVVIVAGDDPNGDQVLERHDTRRSLLTYTRAVETTPWAARMDGLFTAPASGRFVFQGGSLGRFRILLDGESVVDGWDDHGVGDGRRLEGAVDLVAGTQYALHVEYSAVPGVAGAGGWSGVDLRCQPPLAEDAFQRAVDVAAGADAVILVVGTNGDWETEGKDRKTMDLPGRQVELIEAVAAANPRVAVVVNAGAPLSMDWASNVPAVLQSWFLGQETGHALADVLTGTVDASGRLPTTIPWKLEDTPAYTSYPGEFGQVHYGEGLFVGYRWYDRRRIVPAFPFGHGLSYTTFAHEQVQAVASGSRATVSVRVVNTGDRDGVETVQVYVGHPGARVERPVKELAAFTKVRLGAGQAADVVLELGPDAFAYWSPDAGRWQVDDGTYEIHVGSSAAVIHRTVPVTISGTARPG